MSAIAFHEKAGRTCSQWRRGMKARTVLLTLVLCFLAGAVCFASDIQMGTWKSGLWEKLEDTPDHSDCSD